MTPTFTATIENGKLRLSNPKPFFDHLGTLKGEVIVTVQKRRKPRSDKENRYYNGVILKILGDELGYVRNDMHEIVRREFLTIYDGKFTYVRSTASLSTVEMEDFLSKVRMWASMELKIYLPLPNEVVIN